MEKKTKIILKIIVCIIIFWSISLNLDFNKIINGILQINLSLFPIIIIISAFSLIIMTLKWKIIIDNEEKISTINLIKIYWASEFMGLFGLGSIGSEAYKMIHFKRKKRILLLSIADKAYSFLTYIIIVFALGIPFIIFKEINYKTIFFSTLIYIIIVIISPTILNFFLKKFKSINIKNKKIRKITEIEILNNKQFFCHSLLSLIFIINLFLLYKVLFIVVGVQTNLTLLLIIPIITILITLPISFQGLGVREGVLMLYSSFQNLNPEMVILGSLLLFNVSIIYRLTGIIPFLSIKEK